MGNIRSRTLLKTKWASLFVVTAVAGLCALFFIWKFHSMEAAKLSEAIERVRLSARQGNPDAEFELALLYSKGKGVVQNDVEAARWYQKAAEQGLAMAQSNLGNMYLVGQGLPQDYAKATYWSQKAADQGDIKAEGILGYLYFNGLGVRLDYDKSALWYRKAADAGEVESQKALGYMYLHGQGVPYDRNEAVHWYHRAADQGDREAQRDLRWMEGRSSRRWWELVTTIIALPAGLLFFLESLFRRRKLRHWRQGATTIMGICFLSCAVLNAFDFFNDGMLYSSYHRSFEVIRILATGIAVLIIIAVVLPAKSTSTGH